jgi:hypothetical protein
VIQTALWMTSEQGQRIPAEVGGTLSPAAAAMYDWSKSFRKTPTDAAALRQVPVGDANARRPAPNPAGCLGAFSPAAVLRLECGWLVGNDPRHRRDAERLSDSFGEERTRLAHAGMSHFDLTPSCRRRSKPFALHAGAASGATGQDAGTGRGEGASAFY